MRIKTRSVGLHICGVLLLRPGDTQTEVEMETMSGIKTIRAHSFLHCTLLVWRHTPCRTVSLPLTALVQDKQRTSLRCHLKSCVFPSPSPFAVQMAPQRSANEHTGMLIRVHRGNPSRGWKLAKGWRNSFTTSTFMCSMNILHDGVCHKNVQLSTRQTPSNAESGAQIDSL